jgi:capsular exopolysaccharide synthesis family protein
MPDVTSWSPPDYLRHLRRGWRAIVVIAVLGAAAGFAISSQQTKKYTASTRLYMSIQAGASAQELSEGSTFIQGQISSYTAIVSTPAVLGPAARRLHISGGPSAIASSISAGAPPASAVVTISATSTDPATAARLANAVSRSFAALTPRLEVRRHGQPSPVKVTTVQYATPPSTPSSPRRKLEVLFGAFIGLIVGLAFAIGRGLIDTRLKTVEDVDAATDLAMLGTIPKARARQPVALSESDDRLTTEAYKQLRTSLQFANVTHEARTICVSSAVASEGKTRTAVNLAIAYGRAGRNVVLVDADLRRPTAARGLGATPEVGITNLLALEGELDTTLQHVSVGDAEISVLSSGPVPPNPSEMLESDAFRELLSELRDQFDVVLIDGPPVLPVAEASTLAALADGVLLVVGLGTVRRRELRQCLQRLALVDARCIGVVVNRAKTRQVTRRYYGGYYAPSDNGHGPSDRLLIRRR